jgi:hypothetical protein
MLIARLGFGLLILLAAALLWKPVNAQQADKISLPSLLEQGFEIKGVDYNIGIVVQKGKVVYTCSWAGADRITSCYALN